MGHPKLGSGFIRVEIEPGNDAMCEFEHVALALRDVARQLEYEVITGSIRDENGNTVCHWGREEE